MRSTRATSAVERLNTRAGVRHYSMVRTSGELFFLVQRADSNAVATLSEPLPLDEFVAFVNAYGPQKTRRVSKLDTAFEKQLVKKSTGGGLSEGTSPPRQKKRQ